MSNSKAISAIVCRHSVFIFSCSPPASSLSDYEANVQTTADPGLGTNTSSSFRTVPKSNYCNANLACRLLNARSVVNKNPCGRDGRTICDAQCVPKSTSVTLAVDEKTLSMATITGRTDRRTDRVRRNMRPLLGRRAA